MATLRSLGLVALFMVLHVMVVRDVVATARLGARHGARRRLLAHGNLLTEYIGASGSDSIAFTDVPLVGGVSYIFPLAFAIDADASGNTQNGVFSPYWSTALTPADAQEFAAAHSNVKISVSLGGATQFISATDTRNVQWYDPADTSAWITNAVNSITNLASQYSITGIDVDYENFTLGSATFTECIGGLITQLKTNKVITVASIAPFQEVQSEYTDLFNAYQSVIDYVNWQFYANDFQTESEYVNSFNNIASIFGANKLLASVSPGGPGITGSTFIGAVEQLAEVAGIMIFEADSDKLNNFQETNDANTFLTSSGSFLELSH